MVGKGRCEREEGNRWMVSVGKRWNSNAGNGQAGRGMKHDGGMEKDDSGDGWRHARMDGWRWRKREGESRIRMEREGEGVRGRQRDGL